MVSIPDGLAGKVVNIVMDTAMLGGHTHVKVMGISSYEMAVTFTDVDAIHANVLSTINTPGAPEDPVECKYLLVRGADGGTEAIADVWMDNITVVDTVRINIRNVSLDSIDDIPLIRRQLAAIGYDDLDIEVMDR